MGCVGLKREVISYVSMLPGRGKRGKGKEVGLFGGGRDFSIFLLIIRSNLLRPLSFVLRELESPGALDVDLDFLVCT